MTKRILSIMLTLCMVLMLAPKAVFAESSTGSKSSYTKACEAIDKEYTYTGHDLGATYTPEATTFKVWAPTATEVYLNQFSTGSDEEPGAEDLGSYELTKLLDGEKWTGVWTITIEGDQKNVHYTYTITATKPTGTQTITKQIQDIYSVAAGVNGKRSMVCDLDSTDPEDWQKDSHVFVDETTDSLVWELNIKCFSYDSASGVSEANRGKYLAFTESGTTLNGKGNVSTCVDYLKEMGVKTVRLNPFYDFGSVGESDSVSQDIMDIGSQNFNVPEDSYSSNPYDGNVRIKECKQMIQALHNAGISVVMDVDYTHTALKDSCFQGTVPDYYYRLAGDGTFSDRYGFGNELATERAMYREYVIQSLLYWVNEYHVDGFNFNSMGLMDAETMQLIRNALNKVNSRITTRDDGYSSVCSYHSSDATYKLQSVNGQSWKKCQYCGDEIGKSELKDTVIEKSPENEESVSNVTKTIARTNTDKNDAKGSSFAPLKLKATSSKNKTVKLSWSKVSGAEGYIVYGAMRGKTMKKIKTTTGKSYTVKNLKKDKYYKYMVVAYKTDKGQQVAFSISKIAHIAVKGGKYGNSTKITVKKINPIKKGKKITLKATVKNSKKKVKTYVKLRYESTNTKIATVSSKGVITAKGKGVCYIYVYAQNGVYKKVKVTVKE